MSVQRDVRDGISCRPAPARPRSPSAHPDQRVGVLDRCVAILRASRRRPVVHDIVDSTGLTRSTAHRLIQGLEDHGFLLRIGGLGYALGPRLLALAASASRDLPLRELAHPSLERLARSTGESAQLYVRDGDRRVCIDASESESELRTIVEIGASLPLTKGWRARSSAWAGAHDRARLVETADDPIRLERRLVTTRRRGWAESGRRACAGVASVQRADRRAGRSPRRRGLRLRAGSTSGIAPREAPRARGDRGGAGDRGRARRLATRRRPREPDRRDRGRSRRAPLGRRRRAAPPRRGTSSPAAPRSSGR